MRDAFDDWGREPRPRWAWVWPLTITLGVLWLLAPRIELALWPVLGRQEIDDVSRVGGHLCWERLSDKFRVPEIWNYDVFLDRVSNGRLVHSFPEIFSEVPPHDPLSTDRTPSIGWTRRRLCIDLPPSIGPDQPVRLRQTVHFRGFLGLWDLAVPLPGIVDPGGASVPP